MGLGALLLLLASVLCGAAYPSPAARGGLPWSRFTKSCERRLSQPLARFYGSRPHPDLSMISPGVLWTRDDANLAILPQWTAGGNLTVPFMDTHIAVRFLGGVSNRVDATAAGCVDRVKGLRKPGGVDRDGLWCDLVVRQPDGSLQTRFDLIHSRLDRFVDNGIDLMIVLGDVPWAFVDETPPTPTCPGFGCQYLPPKDPQEFATWMGTVASYFLKSYAEKTKESSPVRVGVCVCVCVVVVTREGRACK